MRIVFLSNYLTHHQTELCEAIASQKNVEFFFIQTEEMSSERKNMGWEIDLSHYNFLVDFNHVGNYVINEILGSADVIILGDTKIDITFVDLKTNVLVLLYRERLFKVKRKFQIIRRIRIWYKYGWKYRKIKTAVLCASSYTSLDFKDCWSFTNRCYKWGYYPKMKTFDIEALLNNKKADDKIKILWAGRLIHWKRCIDLLEAAKILVNLGEKFQIDIVGTGVLEKQILEYIVKNNLDSYVKLRGSCPFEKVRLYMEQANIYVLTSNQEEGWGAVVNEAMNSACAVIGSNLAGAIPFLIRNGENGIIYETGNVDELSKKIQYLIHNPEIAAQMGKRAYYSIQKEWNAGIAAQRLMILIDALSKAQETPFLSGPCSVARKAASWE